MKSITQCKDVVTGEGVVTAARPAVGGHVHLGYFLVGEVALVGMVAMSMVGGTKVIQDVDRTPLVGVAEPTANPNPGTGLNDPAGPGAAPAPNQPDRVDGGGTTAIAIQVSRHAFPGGTAGVYLACLGNPADTLAASIMPSGPILLVPADGSTPPVVFEEIKRLSPGKVILLGDKSVISNNVAGQITTCADKNTVRISGANRVTTAATIASYAYPGRNPTVYVTDAMGADGKGSSDAVAAGVLTDGPIITVTTSGGGVATAAQTVKTLGANRVVALDGKAAVSGTTLNQVVGGSATDRVSGPNRYQASVAIGQRVFDTSAGNVYLASGTDLAYALVAGLPTDGLVILVPGTADGSIRGLMASFGNPNVNTIGDSSSVSNSVPQVAAGYAQPQVAQQPQKSSAPVAGISQVYTKYLIQPSPTSGAREEVIHNVINRTRTGHGVPTLTRDPVMNDAARAWAQQIAHTDVFIHSNGVLKHADLFPAGWKYTGEDMVGYYDIGPGPYAVGYNGLWIKSPGHYKNLTDGRFSRAGIGVATGRTWVYAVQSFGQY